MLALCGTFALFLGLFAPPYTTFSETISPIMLAPRPDLQMYVIPRRNVPADRGRERELGRRTEAQGRGRRRGEMTVRAEVIEDSGFRDAILSLVFEILVFLLY